MESSLNSLLLICKQKLENNEELSAVDKKEI